MLHIHFPPHLTHVIALPCKTQKYQILQFLRKTVKKSVRTLSYFHQFNNFWQIHDKIAETLYLVIKVCPAPRTQALRRRRHCMAAIAASTIDWSKRLRSSFRRISSSLTLAILDR